MQKFNDGRDWFFQQRFGLFLHFGLYAIEGWHEQDQMRRRIPRADYARLIDRFNPQEFNADALLDLAESVGMQYVCLTAKHHDGFCLWDSAQTDFKVTRSSCGRDLVRELAEACHRRNFTFGLHYSITDWHHPSYWICASLWYPFVSLSPLRLIAPQRGAGALPPVEVSPRPPRQIPYARTPDYRPPVYPYA